MSARATRTGLVAYRRGGFWGWRRCRRCRRRSCRRSWKKNSSRTEILLLLVSKAYPSSLDCRIGKGTQDLGRGHCHILQCFTKIYRRTTFLLDFFIDREHFLNSAKLPLKFFLYSLNVQSKVFFTPYRHMYHFDVFS